MTLIPAQEATCRGTGGRKDYQHPGPRVWLSVASCATTTAANTTRTATSALSAAASTPSSSRPAPALAGSGATAGYNPCSPPGRSYPLRDRWRAGVAPLVPAKGLTKTLLVQQVDKTTGSVSLLRSRKRRRLFAHGRASPASTTVRRAPTALAPGLREVLAGVGDPSSVARCGTGWRCSGRRSARSRPGVVRRGRRVVGGAA